MSGPAVYATPPGVPVAEAFASGFEARRGPDPLEPARTLVLANNARTLRLTEDALVTAAAGSALLPRLAVLAELGADPLSAPDLPPAIAPVRRHLHMIRLVEAYLAAQGREAPPPAAAPDLASALEALIDECDAEGLAGDALDRAADAAQAEHWGRTLAFVDLVRRNWPAIRDAEEAGALDPNARQRLAVERLAAAWSAAAPGPVIAMGSTGAVASTRLLLAAVARLAGGVVVLPGLDRRMEADVWAEIAAGRAPEHPQAPFAGLLTALGLTPAEVRPWDLDEDGPRRRLLALALRPAPVTDVWQRAAPSLAPEVAAATGGLSVVEAESPREEAAAIALAIREALAEPGVSTALVTPDATLARRVTAELTRFAIVADDSLGRPLAQTPPGVFLRLIGEVARGPLDAVGLLGLLQHPLTRAGTGRGVHLGLLRSYDKRALRGPLPELAPGRLPPWPATPEPADEAALAWHAGIEAALRPLAEAMAAGEPLARLLALHRAAAEALSRGPDGTAAVWEEAAGAAAAKALDALAGAADAHGDGPVTAYATLLAEHLSARQVRPEPTAPHPRVAVLGPREARAQAAGVVILGGLNEGVWPALPDEDPWLSRPMRAAVGLPSPESRIGLSAHDFVQGALRPRVLLTRSKRADGSPTVASRWLIRLENLLGGVGDGTAWGAMRARGERLRRLVARPEVHALAPSGNAARAPRPRPAPPAAARPRRLSVTEVETLVRDAYAIYARRVLRLAPLEPLGRAPDARDRGSALHAILERFVAGLEAVPDPEHARERLMALAERTLAERVAEPDLRRIWRARLARAADWFVEDEVRRRREGAVPAGLERKGTLEIAAPGGPFTLSARADRIDLRPDGSAAIYDYKTGQPPSRNQIKLFSHQLHLQAAILAQGGFEGLEAVRASYGAYLGFTGSGEEGGRTVAADALAEEVDAHLEDFCRLVATYDCETTVYTARGRAERHDREGDYDHLSRRAEWDGEEA